MRMFKTSIMAGMAGNVRSDAELAEAFDTATDVSVSANVAAGGLAVVVSRGSNESAKITLGAGTCFAYLMHNVKTWSDDEQTRLENLEVDEKVFN